MTGGALIATSFLLPDVSSPAGAAAVAGDAQLTAAALMVAVARRHASLTLAWIAELWGIAIVAVLCASTGGATSPFALLYFFAIGHAAAFQPRRRFAFTALAGLLAFLAPVLYSNVSTNFAAIACVGGVLAVLTTVVVHIALERMRSERRRLELLIDATARLDTSLDPEQTLRRIAGMALPELAEVCVVDLVAADGSIAETVAAALDPHLAARVEAAGAERHGQPPDEPIAWTLQRRTTTSLETLDAAPVLQEAIGAGRREGSHPLSATVVPMVARGRVLGAITFVHAHRPADAQRRVLEGLTGRASLAYDNARLYAERARVALTLRRSLMPEALPRIDGLELDGYFRPMGAGSEVGGDFYDVFEDRDGCWLVVGDVCGKGAEAAVLTAFLRHTTVAYARDGSSPADVLSRVNRAMLEKDFEGRFATAVLARLEYGSQGIRVTIASAGHPPALVSRADGSCAEFGSGGTLLGVFPDARVGESETILSPGDGLALYTDGLSEAHAPQRVLTAAEMLEAIASGQPESPRETIGALLGLLDLRRGARDDIAILAARVQSVQARGVRAA
ncbi:MAG TPA: GAF domain-containing SpoIIE family protein phosphatase [Solirubrobacteraceae bacterium]